jgi:hypothetical protein
MRRWCVVVRLPNAMTTAAAVAITAGHQLHSIAAAGLANRPAVWLAVVMRVHMVGMRAFTRPKSVELSETLMLRMVLTSNMAWFTLN